MFLVMDDAQMFRNIAKKKTETSSGDEKPQGKNCALNAQTTNASREISISAVDLELLSFDLQEEKASHVLDITR